MTFKSKFDKIILVKCMNRKTKIILIIIIFISIIMLSYSIINIIIWNIDSNKTNIQIKKIEEVKTNEIEDNKDTNIINNEEITDKFNPYWDYIKMNMIDVDFSELKKINNDVRGWIQVNGTNINYPFLQAKDNKYYLKHSFDKSYNSAGWLFLDYRNNYTDNKNTIIYAHSRLDKTMFGSLRSLLNKSWLNNTNNHVIKISTLKENSLWQVFSVYHIKTTSDYIQTDFSSDMEYQEFLNKIINRSSYNFNTTISSKDNILTLSTCYNDTEKMVVHAKLIKNSSKH